MNNFSSVLCVYIVIETELLVLFSFFSGCTLGRWTTSMGRIESTINFSIEFKELTDKSKGQNDYQTET